MSRILLIGGHGRVALLLEPLLAQAGHTVTAVIRNRDHEEDVAATGATPLVADVQSFDTEQLANLVSGNDVVIWSAGAGGGDPQRTWAVDRDAAIRSIDAAKAAGVGHYVMVSYFGAGPDHGVPEGDSFYAYAEAKAAADAHLRESGVDYTIVAPSALTLDAPTGRITVGGSGEASVPRADVAAVIAAVVEKPAPGRTIEFTGGDTPIDVALAAS